MKYNENINIILLLFLLFGDLKFDQSAVDRLLGFLFFFKH